MPIDDETKETLDNAPEMSPEVQNILFSAFQDGELEIIQYYFNRYPSRINHTIGERTDDGEDYEIDSSAHETALHWAAFELQVDIVRYLLSVPGIEINLGNAQLEGPIHNIFLGYNSSDTDPQKELDLLQILQLFLNTKKIIPELHDKTAFESACKNKHGHVLFMLYQYMKFKDYDVKNIAKRIPQYAAILDQCKDIDVFFTLCKQVKTGEAIEFFERNKRDYITYSNLQGETPLYIAAASNQTELVDLLLKNIRSDFGLYYFLPDKHPLLAAIENFNPTILGKLLRRMDPKMIPDQIKLQLYEKYLELLSVEKGLQASIAHSKLTQDRLKTQVNSRADNNVKEILRLLSNKFGFAHTLATHPPAHLTQALAQTGMQNQNPGKRTAEEQAGSDPKKPRSL